MQAPSPSQRASALSTTRPFSIDSAPSAQDGRHSPQPSQSCSFISTMSLSDFLRRPAGRSVWLAIVMARPPSLTPTVSINTITISLIAIKIPRVYFKFHWTRKTNKIWSLFLFGFPKAENSVKKL
jgi:hypothetical protein